ncbi:hypothetical protein CPB84DRAFT_1754072 [Gymnopilus junonius]|uniref:Uncharacterized protein n=1 Tax=Gymnopilus junonius TaxID=109634 RepID=A0A9P5N8Q6_GYMJU|nr:hypothetical protein CPB84DRAFT_1754072 [Gymnopilus junonius]
MPHKKPIHWSPKIFKDRVVNAKIYNFTIYLWEGCKSHPFQISCKKPVIGLERNAALRKLGVQWRGDLYVLWIGKRNPLYPVDMYLMQLKSFLQRLNKLCLEMYQQNSISADGDGWDVLMTCRP